MTWCLHRCYKLVPPVHPVLLCTCPWPGHLLGPLHRSYITGVSDANRLDWFSVTGASGATVSSELVQFSVSLSSFFVFCFAWPFCFIHGLYNCSLDKLISSIDCVATQSPKSQNNGLMGPFSLQSSPFWRLMTTQSKQA